MKQGEMKDLEHILEVKFNERQRAFANAVAAENALRAELAKLDAMAAAAAQSDHENMRAIGADIIWKAWLGRMKTSLNLELAQVLAQKDRLIHRVRKDYGRLLASRKLHQTHVAQRETRAKSQALSRVLEEHLFRDVKSRR